MIRSTREVARLLGVTPGSISKAISSDRLDPPAKGPGGAYMWTTEDVRRACWVLLRRDLDDVLAEREQSAAGGRTAP